MKKAVIVRKFNPNQLDQIVEDGFRYFKIDEKLHKIRSVFIKPNLVTDISKYIEQGANTDVRIIESVIKYLTKFNNLKIYLGESETGTKIKGRKLNRALELMGVTDLKKKYDFEIINLTYDDKILVEIPGGVHIKKIELGRTMVESDLIINLPKIKTHKYATITCALKNLFGVIPDPLRIIYHENIHQVLSDLNRIFFNKMFIVTDGIIGMEGAGPLYGNKVNLNLLLFSDNPIINDVIAAKIMRIPPEEIKHIQIANLWGNFNLDEIEVVGDAKLEDVAIQFKKANKNAFIKLEGKLMQYRWIVKIIFNDWFRKNITYKFNKILVKLRGGSYRWHIEDKSDE